MDRVKLGRALGYGARHAAKTLVQAVDAATTPSPARPQVQEVRTRAAAAPQRVRAVSAAAKVAGKSVWSPLARFSSVLWLEVTGTFFLLIAAVFAGGLWKSRGAVGMAVRSPDAGRLYVYAAAFVVFAYFGVSNFVRAWRREKL